MKKSILLLTAIAFFAFSTTNAQEASKKKKTKKTTKVTKTTTVVDSKTTTAKVEAPKVVTKAAVPTTDGASMLFDSDTVDYGTIAHNGEPKREFSFVNNGNKPLIISAAQGSCGCTVPSYPKEPIAPGARGVIGVRYDTNRAGPFTKTITLTTNAATPSKVLTIKGTVQPATNAATPATPAATPKS